MRIDNSLILVGMPGSGKSTLGVLLAKELGVEFVDTDLLIQIRENKTLQEILDERDYLFLRSVEEQVLMEVSTIPPKVIATGGSAVYSQKGMEHLRKQAQVVYIKVGIEELRNRIHNYESRGIARRPDQSCESLLEERSALYEQFADLSLDANKMSTQQCLDALLKMVL